MKTPLPQADELEALLRESTTLEDAPEHLIQRAIDLGPLTPAARPAASAGPWKRLLASLSFDSASVGADAMALGLRGEPAVQRQWLFSCEAHDIDLRGQALDDSAGAAWLLSGQVLGPETEGLVLLYGPSPENTQARQQCRLGEMADFTFDALPAGSYRLAIQLGDQTIELPAITLGSDDATAA